jgi:hypothetical protein
MAFTVAGALAIRLAIARTLLISSSLNPEVESPAARSPNASAMTATMKVVVVAARDSANPCEEASVSALVCVVGTAAALIVGG